MTPGLLRRALRAASRPLRQAFLLWKDLRGEVWILRGTQRGAPGPFAVAFVGSLASRHYAARLALGPDARHESLGRHWSWRVPALVRERAPDCGLLIREVSRAARAPLGEPEALRLPTWPPMMLDARAPGFERTDRYLRTRKRLLKADVEFEATRDLAALKDFHANMYRPYILARHGKTSLLTDYPDLERDFAAHDRELVLIKRAGAALGGCVVDYAPHGVQLLDIGLRDGADELLKGHISDLLYLGIFKRALERSTGMVHFGFVWPFVTDGVVDYKRRWGAAFPATLAGGDAFSLTFLHASPALDRFLEANPCVAFAEGDALRLCVFGGEDAAARHAQLREQFCGEGLPFQAFAAPYDDLSARG